MAERDPNAAATACCDPATGVVQPLCAIYEPATLAGLAKETAGGTGPSPRAYLESRPLKLIPMHITNINSPDDLRKHHAQRSHDLMSENDSNKPTRSEAERAVRVLLGWTGDDVEREGLVDTPKRVVRAFEEWFSGYAVDPYDFLARTFKEVNGYDEIVALTHIDFNSHCEHHIAPIIGKAHVAYLPRDKVVGISKLARVVDAYARRLQVQEKLTAQIAECISNVLEPRGVAVVVEGAHECMTTRGIQKRNVNMVTSQMLGIFRDDARARAEFLAMIDRGR